MINKNLDKLDNLDQSKHLLQDILIRQKASDTAKKLLLAFHEELIRQYKTKDPTKIARTHIRGITYMVNEKKAFMGVDVHQQHISVLFFTGNSTIEGLVKANWLRGGDNHGSKMFRIKDEDTLASAIKFAIRAHKIASDWSFSKD